MNSRGERPSGDDSSAGSERLHARAAWICSRQGCQKPATWRAVLILVGAHGREARASVLVSHRGKSCPVVVCDAHRSVAALSYAELIDWETLADAYARASGEAPVRDLARITYPEIDSAEARALDAMPR